MKNLLRRISAVVLALTMMTSMLAVAHAEDTTTGVFYFSKVSSEPVEAGVLTTFTVSLKDCDQLSGFGLVHKITNSSGEDVTSSFTHTGNWLTPTGPLLEVDEDGLTSVIGTFERAYTNIVWHDGADHDVNGTVFTMKLTPSTDLVNGEYTIVLALLADEPTNVCNLATKAAVPVVFEPFTFTLTGGTEAVTTHKVTFDTGDNATVALAEDETATLADNTATVNDGSDLRFTVTPDEGYNVASVTAGGETLEAVDDVYTLSNITADTTVTISAKEAEKPIYAVNFTGDNADVKINGVTVTSTTVTEGGSVSFTVAPAEGYTVTSVKVGETELTADENGDYTLSSVAADTTVEITTRVAVKTYDVTFTGENATVTVNGETVTSTTVTEGESVSFSVNPADGYAVTSVTANGTALEGGTDGVYTLSNVNVDTAVSITADKIVANYFNSGSGTADDPYIIAESGELVCLATVISDSATNADYASAYYKLAGDLDLGDMEWTPIGKSASLPFSGVFDGDGHTISGLYINTTDTYQGLFGYVKTGTIQNLIVSGSVKGGNYTGGLVGCLQNSSVINCGNEANVTGSASVGGLVGYAFGTSSTTTSNVIITSCYNAGTVVTTGTANTSGVGGIAGVLKSPSQVTDCYNMGEITANTKADGGGIVGYANDANANYVEYVENCFGVGKIGGDSINRGALLGRVYSASYLYMTNSYYLTSAYETDVATDSTAVTEADLATLADKLGSAFKATTAGTVTFAGEHAKALVDGAAVTSTTAVGYPALVWEDVTTRDSGAVAFTVQTDAGYAVSTVTVDGDVLEADENGVYTLLAVSKNTAVLITTEETGITTTYEVAFTGNKVTVALTDGTLTLTDDNKVTVTEGESISFTVTPDEGYEVISVKVGETDVPYDEATGAYTLSVAAAAEVVITAQVKSEPEADYTVSLKPSAAEVEASKTVTVDVVVTPGAEKKFAAWDITLTYDTTLFTYKPASDTDTTNGTVTEAETAGTLHLTSTNNENFNSETTIATLVFTAADGKEGQTGNFNLTQAKLAESGKALTENAVSADILNNASVKIKEIETYAVTFYQEDGTTVIGTINVLKNTGKIDNTELAGIVAPAVAHKEFESWKLDETTSYTAAQLLQLTVTGDMSLTATYKATEYMVTHTGITGADKATNFAAYEGTIQNYSSNYTYTVTVKVADGTVLYTVENTGINSTGKFTIPAGKITGNVTMEVTKSMGKVAIQVYENYVAGKGENGTAYSLVVVYGTAAGYTYDGNAMYRVAAYDNDKANTISGGMAYAYMIADEGTTVDDVEKVLKVADTTDDAHKITASNDVNGTVTIDIADAQAVRDCYNAKNADSVKLMPTYLRADRDGDHEVDSDDITIVMDKLTP